MSNPIAIPNKEKLPPLIISHDTSSDTDSDTIKSPTKSALKEGLRTSSPKSVSFSENSIVYVFETSEWEAKGDIIVDKKSTLRKLTKSVGRMFGSSPK